MWPFQSRTLKQIQMFQDSWPILIWPCDEYPVVLISPTWELWAQTTILTGVSGISSRVALKLAIHLITQLMVSRNESDLRFQDATYPG
jgi:hypothetical protein